MCRPRCHTCGRDHEYCPDCGRPIPPGPTFGPPTYPYAFPSQILSQQMAMAGQLASMNFPSSPPGHRLDGYASLAPSSMDIRQQLSDHALFG